MTKLKEHIDKTLDSNLNDWVEETMFNFGVEKDSYDPELIKKVLRFGYYTGSFTVVDFLENEIQ
jgi:hypothetical protein